MIFGGLTHVFFKHLGLVMLCFPSSDGCGMVYVKPFGALCLNPSGQVSISQLAPFLALSAMGIEKECADHRNCSPRLGMRVRIEAQCTLC